MSEAVCYTWNMVEKMNKRKGIILAIVGAALWGTSGTAAEMLYQNPNINTFWLVGVRSWLAGLSLLAISFLTKGKKTLTIFQDKHDLLSGILYAIFGILGVQFTYFYTVKSSNAPTATVLVFLAPVLVIAYMALKSRQLPRRIDLISIAVAIIGTAILVTNGNFGQLAVSPRTLIWGFFSALTQAIAVVMPAKLFKKYSTMTILAWGLLLSGILFTPFIIFMPAQHVTFKEWTLVIYIVIAGTILAYTLYLSSVVYISAGLASMLEAFEPLVATILSVGLLGSDFGIMKMVGGSLIIFATFLQVIPSPRPGKLHRNRL